MTVDTADIWCHHMRAPKPTLHTASSQSTELGTILFSYCFKPQVFGVVCYVKINGHMISSTFYTQPLIRNFIHTNKGSKCQKIIDSFLTNGRNSHHYQNLCNLLSLTCTSWNLTVLFFIPWPIWLWRNIMIMWLDFKSNITFSYQTFQNNSKAFAYEKLDVALLDFNNSSLRFKL